MVRAGGGGEGPQHSLQRCPVAPCQHSLPRCFTAHTMEPNSPKKIQFSVPLFQSQLDPQAAEHVSASSVTVTTFTSDLIFFLKPSGEGLMRYLNLCGIKCVHTTDCMLTAVELSFSQSWIKLPCSNNCF